MASSGYVADTFVAGEQPTTAKWNELWGNDASFNTGNGFNDGIILTRHIAASAVQAGGIDFTTFPWQYNTEQAAGTNGTKTVYRYIWHGAHTVAVGNNHIAHGISGITEVLGISGVSDLGTAGVDKYILPRVEPSNSMSVDVDATNINLSATFAWGSCHSTFMVHYIK